MDLLYRVKIFFIALRGNRYTWPTIGISLSDNRHFHLISSIHVNNHDMAPLPAKLLKKLSHIDVLIVETDASGDDAPFANLPTSAALGERISPEQLENLRGVTNELGISPSLLSIQPLW